MNDAVDRRPLPDSVGLVFLVGSLARFLADGTPYATKAPWVAVPVFVLGCYVWNWWSRRRSPGRVLIVEDHEGERYMLGRMFGAKGWKVEMAPTAADALHRLDNRKAPVLSWVILDLMLPDQPGSLVLRRARMLRPSPRVAVFTGRMTGTQEWEAVLGLGADYVLEKNSTGVDELQRLMEARS